MKSVTKTQKEAKLLAIKRHIKKRNENQGRSIPDAKSQANYERTLKIVAVEGITKMFNAMANIQKESLDQVLKMSLDDKIGAGAARKKFKKGFQKRGKSGGPKGKGDKGGNFMGRKF